MAKSYLFILLLLTVMLRCGISSEPEEPGFSLPNGQWIDLSHAYDAETPYWPTAEGFTLDTVSEGMTPGGYYYSAFSFRSAEHGGTHIDAPIHFSKGKRTVDEIPIDQLAGLAVVIDISDSVRGYIDYQVTAEDFQKWEAIHGEIPEGAIVLIHTGFAKRWPDRMSYMGTNLRGLEAVALLHFPGLHPDAARWLIANRNIKAIGLDTPSIDYGRSSDFMSHRILFEKNIPAFENLANLDQLPPVGAYVIGLPMKIKGGSGGPLRIAAWLESQG